MKSNYKDDRAELNYIRSMLPDYLQRAGYPLNRNFICLNPAHEDRRPSMRYWANAQKVHCFSCGVSYDIFDVIEIIKGLEKGQGIPEAKKIYGMGNGHNLAKVDIPQYKPQPAPVEEPVADSNVFADITDSPAAAYLMARGITAETIEHHKDKLQYCEAWRHPKAPTAPPSPRLIIKDEGGYMARLITNDAAQKKYEKLRFGSWGLFNAEALTSGQTVFVTEGAIDAMTLFQLGAGSAQVLAMGNANGIDAIIDRLTAMKPEARPPSIVIAADDDDNNTGRAAADVLGDALSALKIPYHIHINWGTDKDGKKCKDANEGMMNHRAGVQGAYFDFISEPLRIVKEVEALLEAETNKGSDAELVKEFLEEWGADKPEPVLSIGFDSIDYLLGGGLYRGLYVIGANPAAGKTAIAVQIADSLAQQGRDVLFFCLEMTRRQLLARHISRLTYVMAKSKDKYFNPDIIQQLARSAREVMGRGWVYNKGARNMVSLDENQLDHVTAAAQKYAEYAGHIHTIEAGLVDDDNKDVARTADDILGFTKSYRDATHRAPVVIVDYLQILGSGDDDESDKKRISNAVFTLKKLAKELTVIVVSSFNRQSYRLRPGMDAFKESGEIEYTAEVLMALHKSYIVPNGDSVLTYKDCGDEALRPITVDILKNRMGIAGESVDLLFSARYNDFVEQPEDWRGKEPWATGGAEVIQEARTKAAEKKAQQTVEAKLADDMAKKMTAGDVAEKKSKKGTVTLPPLPDNISTT